MGDIDGIIAALKVVARDAKKRNIWEDCDPVIVSRWVQALPDASNGAWQHLILRGSRNGWAYWHEVVTHAEALIAYLEASRKTLNARLNGGGGDEHVIPPLPENTIEGEFKDITERKRKSRKLLKQIPFFRR